MIYSLGQTVSEVFPHFPHVLAVDGAVSVHVFAIVGSRDRHSHLATGEGLIGLVDGLTGVDVARQHIHAHAHARNGLTGGAHDIRQGHGDFLHVGDPGQVDGHRVTGKGWATLDSTNARGEAGASADNVIAEGENERVTARCVTAFHSWLTG